MTTEAAARLRELTAAYRAEGARQRAADAPLRAQRRHLAKLLSAAQTSVTRAEDKLRRFDADPPYSGYFPHQAAKERAVIEQQLMEACARFTSRETDLAVFERLHSMETI